jgi:hypothetical protein
MTTYVEIKQNKKPTQNTQTKKSSQTPLLIASKMNVYHLECHIFASSLKDELHLVWCYAKKNASQSANVDPVFLSFAFYPVCCCSP